MSWKGGSSSSKSREEDEQKGSNKVPLWNGKAEDFQHYIQEIRWYLAATKATERQYAAARLVRRMLESEYTALRTLMYKLNPEDFADEQGIQKLVTFLENSPMNRQAIPDAGAKLSQYYRKLNRRPNETIPQFLVREEFSYDTMWKSLQRLLREKQIDFSKYDVTEKELRIFCGMKPDESFFYDEDDDEPIPEEEEFPEPPDDDGESATTQNPFASRPGSRPHSRTPSRSGSQPGSRKGGGKNKPIQVAPRKRDLLEMLMSKGVIPIAALDIIRGWMILEATASSDYDKSLIKAATQNKLGYAEIRSALLSMHEDRDRIPQALLRPRHPRSHLAGWIGENNDEYGDPMADDYQEQFMGDVWEGQEGWEEGMYQGDAWQGQEENPEEQVPEESEDSEQAALLSQLADEEKGLQAMLADTQRNLMQARQAVADSRRDRGWQNQPKAKPTSTFLSKGKGKTKSKGNSPSPGFYNSPQSSQMMWNSKGFPKGGKRSFSSFSQGKGKGKPHQKAWFHDTYESGMLALETDVDDLFAVNTKSAPVSSNDHVSHPEPGGTKGVIDTGATVSAGGRKAVQDLVTELAKIRPDLSVKVVEDRPHFRFGNGRWGQALFKVEINTGGSTFQVYSLPAENVPVLVGMRELVQLDVILNCSTRHAIVAGKPCVLQTTAKGHALLDFATDIPLSNADDQSNQFVLEHVDTACVDEADEEEDFESLGDERDCHMLDFSMFTMEKFTDDRQHFQSHLGVDASQWSFLMQPRVSVSEQISQPSETSASSNHGGKDRVEEPDERSCEGGVARIPKRSCLKHGERPAAWKPKVTIQEAVPEDHIRSVKGHDSSLGIRSKGKRPPVAVPREAHLEGVQQQVRKVDRMCDLFPEDKLHSGRGGTSQQSSASSWAKCDCSTGETSFNRMDQGIFGAEHGQEHDQNCDLRECSQTSFQESIQSGKEVQSPRGAREHLGRIVRGGARQDKPSAEGSCSTSASSEVEPVMVESNVNRMTKSQKGSLSNCVNTNWAIFDSSRALRDVRSCESEHLWEICCSPHSALSQEMKRQKFQATRFNYESGFDLGNKTKVEEVISRIPQEKPTRIWGSPRCTAVTNIQNLNQKTEVQRRELYKKRLRTIREIKNLVSIFKAAYSRKPGSTHIYMEWPKNAHFGWNLKEWRDLEKWFKEKYSQPLYWTEIHGCMYGLRYKGELLNKPWYVLTTDFDFYCSAAIQCDGSHNHVPIVGLGSQAVHDTAYYPAEMVRRVVQIWKKQWFNLSHSDVMKHLYNTRINDEELKQLLVEADRWSIQELFPLQ